MSAAQLLNPKAESRVSIPGSWEKLKVLLINHQRRGEALKVNISAGEGLQDVLRSNLGPTGTIKMCCSFSGFLDQAVNALFRLVDGAGAVCVTATLLSISHVGEIHIDVSADQIDERWQCTTSGNGEYEQELERILSDFSSKYKTRRLYVRSEAVKGRCIDLPRS